MLDEMLAEYAEAADLNQALAEEHMEAFLEALERSLKDDEEIVD